MIQKVKFCICAMVGILAGGTAALVVLGAIERAHQQHPVLVTIGLLAGLAAVVIHEWGTIEW